MQTVNEVFNGLLPVINSQINVSLIISVLAGVIGSAIGLVFMWWGVRNLIFILMNAFKNGSLSAGGVSGTGETRAEFEDRMKKEHEFLWKNTDIMG